MSKHIPVKNRIPLGPRKKPTNEVTSGTLKTRKKFEENPELHEKYLKGLQVYYQKNKPQLSNKKAATRKRRILELMNMLDGKCDSCGEPYDPNVQPTNLQIHHLYYDEIDLQYLKRYSTHGETFRGVLRFAKNNDPKSKYRLLCKECHMMETAIKQDTHKFWHCLSWLIERKILDVNAIDTIENKTIAEFLKKKIN